jgi:hypothetical protein
VAQPARWPLPLSSSQIFFVKILILSRNFIGINHTFMKSKRKGVFQKEAETEEDISYCKEVI